MEINGHKSLAYWECHHGYGNQLYKYMKDTKVSLVFQLRLNRSVCPFCQNLAKFYFGESSLKHLKVAYRTFMEPLWYQTNLIEDLGQFDRFA